MSVIRFLERPAPIALDPAIALLANEPQGAVFDFINMRGYIRDRVTPGNNWMGDPNAKLIRAAPSAKMVMGSDGLFRSGTALRCEYNAAQEPLGIRAEAQRTNLLLNSDFQNGVTDATTRAGIVASTFPRLPNNTGIAFAADGTLAYAYKNATYVSGTAYTLSFFVQVDDSLGPPVFAAAAGTSPLNDFCLNMQGNAYTTINVVEDLGGGLYRVSASVTAGASGNASGIVRYASNRQRPLRISGYQLEAGLFPSSYIPTAGAQVTRAADNIDLLLTALPSGILAQGSFQAEVRIADISNDVTGGQYRAAFGLFDLPSNSILANCINQGIRLYFCGSTASNYSFINNVIPVNSHGKIAGAWDSGGAVASAAGALGAQTLGGNPGGINTLRIGRAAAAAGWLNGHLRAFKIIPRRASNAEIAAWTA